MRSTTPTSPYAPSTIVGASGAELRRRAVGISHRRVTSVTTTSSGAVTSSWVLSETPAAAARAQIRPPVTAPTDHMPWKRLMIGRCRARSAPIAWLFIATSVSPSSAPAARSTGNSSTALLATATSGRSDASITDVDTHMRRLPKRSTSAPEKMLVSNPPSPTPTSVRPRPASDTSMRSRISGRRGSHDAADAPLTKNIAPIAIAVARRAAIGAAVSERDERTISAVSERSERTISAVSERSERTSAQGGGGVLHRRVGAGSLVAVSLSAHGDRRCRQRDPASHLYSRRRGRRDAVPQPASARNRARHSTSPSERATPPACPSKSCATSTTR